MCVCVYAAGRTPWCWFGDRSGTLSSHHLTRAHLLIDQHSAHRHTDICSHTKSRHMQFALSLDITHTYVTVCIMCCSRCVSNAYRVYAIYRACRCCVVAACSHTSITHTHIHTNDRPIKWRVYKRACLLVHIHHTKTVVVAVVALRQWHRIWVGGSQHKRTLSIRVCVCVRSQHYITRRVCDILWNKQKAKHMYGICMCVVC